jgi:hypothetical protein
MEDEWRRAKRCDIANLYLIVLESYEQASVAAYALLSDPRRYLCMSADPTDNVYVEPYHKHICYRWGKV